MVEETRAFVRNGEVVDPNEEEDEVAVAFEREDARLSEELSEAKALEEGGVVLLPKLAALLAALESLLELAHE